MPAPRDEPPHSEASTRARDTTRPMMTRDAPVVDDRIALLAHHDAQALVAFGEAGDRRAADLLLDAARVARALPEPRPGSQVLLVFEGDRYALAAALLGSLHRGHAIALPPNSRRDSILAVREHPSTVAVAHDTQAGLEIDVPALLAGARDAAPLARPIRSPADVMATVFTSGTTGPMTAWKKSSAELIGEALGLARAFGIGPEDRILATVPAGHIYGLLFSVLLPLVTGAAFCRETPHHAEAVAHAARRHGATVLASVPAHLRALAASEAGALAPIRRVFSSTGPLPEATAFDFARRHALPITEILGSTETGGIAHRSRNPDAASNAHADAWQPFEAVRVSVAPSGHLCVDSPYLYADLPRPFQTGDLVSALPDGRFEHLGRADGIVKIAGHRVALGDVEEQLRACAGVEDAAVVAIPAEGARGHQLLAVVAPADLAIGALRERLLERFVPTCLPRRIRCVEALPRESNGKLGREKLLRLFALDATGRPGTMTLAWSEAHSERSDERTRVERRVTIPRDYGWFLGHFDGFPVLAGAVQLKELILPSIEAAFPDLGRFRSMNRVKFNERIVPGDALVLRLTRKQDTPRVAFEVLRDATVCTSGTIVLDSERGAQLESREGCA